MANGKRLNVESTAKKTCAYRVLTHASVVVIHTYIHTYIHKQRTETGNDS